MILKSKIPAIYQEFLSDLLEVNVPDEKIASCSNCNLCLSPKSPYIDLKCCNYFPYMPNFLIGGVLSDPDPSLEQGKQRVLNVIASKKGVSPYGIVRDQKYKNDQDFFLSSDKPFQAKSEMILQQCPYYDEGNCSIWKYREHLCVSFFCSSIAGKNGDAFWGKMDELMKLVEQKIMLEVLNRMGWSADELLVDPFAEDWLHLQLENGERDELTYAQLWKNWQGREAEFYITCFKLTESLSPAEFDELVGTEFIALKKDLLQAAVLFSQNAYPDYLQVHPAVQIEDLGDGVSRLIHTELKHVYETDSVFIPFIKQFDGKRSIEANFKTAYRVIFSLNNLVDKLLELEMLIPVIEVN